MIVQSLILNSPIILACCYGLRLAFRNWPIHQGAGKLMIFALLLKFGDISWAMIQWLIIGLRTNSNPSMFDLVTVAGLVHSMLEAAVLAVLSAAVFYGRAGAATWPLRSH